MCFYLPSLEGRTRGEPIKLGQDNRAWRRNFCRGSRDVDGPANRKEKGWSDLQRHVVLASPRVNIFQRQSVVFCSVLLGDSCGDEALSDQ